MDGSRRTPWTAVSVFAFALALRIGYWSMKGTQISPDTSGFVRVCSGWANEPIALLLSYRGLLFAGFTLPFCGVRALTGGVADAWVVFQLVVSALSCVLVFDAGRRLFTYRAGVVAGVGLAVLFETFSWSIWLLSDTLFVFGISLSIWALALHRTHRTSRTRVTALLCLAWTATIRPFGLPIVLAWLLFDALPPRYRDYRPGILPRTLALPAVVVGGVSLVVLLLGLREFLVDSRIVEYYAEGVVIVNDPTFDYHYTAVRSDSLIGFVVANLPHLVTVSAIRTGVFYLPFVLRFDALHIAVNVVTYLPMVVASLIGAAYLIRERRPEAVTLLVPVVAVTLIVAVTWLSFGFRYRAPLGPVFALLTGYTLFASPLASTWRRSLAERVRRG